MPQVSTPQSFAGFKDFYPYYLSEHANVTSRRLHFVGTTAFVCQWLGALVFASPWLFLSGPITAYAFAWTGHFLFEKNRPATFRHPIYSLTGDFAMAGDILVGRIRW